MCRCPFDPFILLAILALNLHIIVAKIENQNVEIYIMTLQMEPKYEGWSPVNPTLPDGCPHL